MASSPKLGATCSSWLGCPADAADLCPMGDLVEQKAMLTIPWVGSRGRFTIADGELRVRLGVTIRPIGGDETIVQSGGEVEVIDEPWPFGRVRINFRATDGERTVFACPVPSLSEAIVESLEANGFVVRRRSGPRTMKLTGFFYIQYLLWRESRARSAPGPSS